MEVDGSGRDVEHENDTDAMYYAKLKSLNECFVAWIQEHMKQGPHYLFTPVCKDYIAHAEKLEKDYPRAPAGEVPETSSQKSSEPDSSSSKPMPKLTCMTGNGNVVQSKTPATTTITKVEDTNSMDNNAPSSSSTSIPMFNFGEKPPQISSALPKVNFGSNSMSQDTPPPPKLEPAVTFHAPSTSNDNQNEENEDEYQPPKAESTCIEEADSVHTVKCKLYYMKDNKFVEKGIGMLYIKKQDEKKYQLLIRADTTLGNILLNILLIPSLPLTRKKNGILLTCIPNPPIDPKAAPNDTISFFIKVKNEAAAEELLSKLKTCAEN